MSNDKLDRLATNDVWIFTKQAVSFDTAFKAAKLLNEIPNIGNTNVEDYFAKHHESYGIDTNRHRELIIAQMLGLLTKTPYTKGGRYSKEHVTEVFDMLDACVIGSEEYNKLKTEQLLKVKIRSIIDTADNNLNWCILPAIFSYKVLKTLKEQYGISSVTLDQFYTYIMTCSDYSDADAAVGFIKSNCATSTFVAKYKDRSRFLPFFQNNFSLFSIDRNSISINEKYDTYFNEMFMEKFDIDELNIQLSRDVDYTYFLTTHQDFDINLIDEPIYTAHPSITTPTAKLKKKKVVITDTGDVEDDDVDYVTKVNDVKEYNINTAIGKDADKVKPVIKAGSIAKRYSKNPIIGKIALQNADYKCENVSDHTTFTSNTTNKPFMEAHHLIPISYQGCMWDKFGVNIDCVENIASLCPNCHRAIHYSIKSTKRELIEKLYNSQRKKMMGIGLAVTLEELFEIYGV